MPQVISLTYSHEHSALLSGSWAYCRALQALGYSTEIIDLADPNGLKALDAHLKNKNVEFCFGLQGVGSCLTTDAGTNLWTANRTPFLNLHYDHPCHNPFNHFNESPYVGNLYIFQSFLEDKQHYLPSKQLSDFMPFGFLETLPPIQTRFEDRPIRLLYLKAGAPLDELITYINSLPEIIRDGIWQQLKRVETSPDLSLCVLTEEIFNNAGFDRKMKEPQFWGIVQTMDLYLRRKRAIDFVDWLKFQKGAIIIGNGWEFIDKTGAEAVFKPSLNTFDALPLYSQTQFTCNTSPYGWDIIHERAVHGLMMGGCVLSDSNAWWKQHFSDVPALTLYDWTKPLDEQLQPTVTNLKVAAEASRTARKDVIARFPAKRIDTLTSFANKVKAFAAANG